MGQVLHGCVTTTEAVRRAIQHSQESLRALARRYGIIYIAIIAVAVNWLAVWPKGI
jgi:hypothetical protein